MKVYSRHFCRRKHLTFQTAARCIWGRRAAWVEGSGPFAVVAWCDPLTVTLWPDLERAQRAFTNLDSSIGCGSSCVGDHELIRLSERVLERPA
jgi:hypothetical protein